MSLTHTAVSLFGSKVVVPGTGLLLSNGMIGFDPEPGRANSTEAAWLTGLDGSGVTT